MNWQPPIDVVAQSAGDARANDIDPNLYKNVYLVDTSNVSFAFNLDTPSWLISNLQAASDALRAKCVIKELFEKYGQTAPGP